MILKLLGMILLGILSAALSYYKKNYYVGVFDDILGKEEDANVASRVGRGFLYGFFFPIYFVLLISGLAALISFLIAIGIVAAVAFVFVWVTEKILPHEWFGNLLLSLFKKLGLKGPAEAPQPAQEATCGAAPSCTCAAPASSPAATTETSTSEPAAPPKPEEKKD